MRQMIAQSRVCLVAAFILCSTAMSEHTICDTPTSAGTTLARAAAKYVTYARQRLPGPTLLQPQLQRLLHAAKVHHQGACCRSHDQARAEAYEAIRGALCSTVHHVGNACLLSCWQGATGAVQPICPPAVQEELLFSRPVCSLAALCWKAKALLQPAYLSSPSGAGGVMPTGQYTTPASSCAGAAACPPSRASGSGLGSGVIAIRLPCRRMGVAKISRAPCPLPAPGVARQLSACGQRCVACKT